MLGLSDGGTGAAPHKRMGRRLGAEKVGLRVR